MAKASTIVKKPKVQEPQEKVCCVWMGDADRELCWTFRKLEQAFPTLRLATAQLSNAFGSTLQPTHVILASHSRTDDLQSQHEWVSQRWPDAKAIFILGAWWTGHRRCLPLSEEWQVFYWYEWWDGILPLLSKRLDTPIPSKLPTKLQSWIQRSRFPEGSRETKLALVTCDDGASVELWRSILSELGGRPIFRYSKEAIPDGEFDWVLFDLASFHTVEDDCPRAMEQIAILRKKLPRAELMVRTPFPTLPLWESIEAAGADRLLSSLFHFSGLISTTKDPGKDQS